VRPRRLKFDFIYCLRLVNSLSRKPYCSTNPEPWVDK